MARGGLVFDEDVRVVKLVSGVEHIWLQLVGVTGEIGGELIRRRQQFGLVGPVAQPTHQLREPTGLAFGSVGIEASSSSKYEREVQPRSAVPEWVGRWLSVARSLS
jgi:hypothetical protein